MNAVTSKERLPFRPGKLAIGRIDVLNLIAVPAPPQDESHETGDSEDRPIRWRVSIATKVDDPEARAAFAGLDLIHKQYLFSCQVAASLQMPRRTSVEEIPLGPLRDAVVQLFNEVLYGVVSSTVRQLGAIVGAGDLPLPSAAMEPTRYLCAKCEAEEEHSHDH